MKEYSCGEGVCPEDCTDMVCMQETIEDHQTIIRLLKEELNKTKQKLTDTQINLAEVATKLAIAGLL